MDWLVEPVTRDAASALRSELGAFLRRHTADPEAVDHAEVVVAELLANAVEHAGGPVWVSLDWTGKNPVLSVHDLGPSFRLDLSRPEVTSLRGRGLWLVTQLARDLDVVAKRGAGKEAGSGGFSRESFLRALVVEMARGLTDAHGPLAGEESVAGVGVTVLLGPDAVDRTPGGHRYHATPPDPA